MFFDSHCHLTSPELAADFNGVVQRALEQRVTGFLNIADTVESALAAREQAVSAQQRKIRMWCTAGVHPQQATEYRFGAEGTSQQLYALGNDPAVRAIGEIGLDFIYDETHPQYPGAPRPIQAAVLREQLEIATATGLPVVIHNREADEDLLRVLTSYAPRLTGGVFHCFGSSLEVAKRVLDLGFHLGFTGLVTFKNAEAIRQVAKYCPLDRLLIETDAPYLAPVPYRGKTNEPSYLPHIAATISTLHNISSEELADITTRNAFTLFNLT